MPKSGKVLAASILYGVLPVLSFIALFELLILLSKDIGGGSLGRVALRILLIDLVWTPVICIVGFCCYANPRKVRALIAVAVASGIPL